MKHTVTFVFETEEDNVVDEIINYMNARGKAVYYDYSDQTNRNYFAVTRWARGDIEYALGERGIPITDRNIELVEDRASVLEEGSVSYGWDVLDDIVFDIQHPFGSEEGFEGVLSPEEVEEDGSEN